MLGKIVEINGNIVVIDLSINISTVQGLMNLFVLLNDQEKNFVGEIVSINSKQANIKLVGEFVNNNFVSGVSNKPSFSAKVNLLSMTYVNKIIGMDDSKPLGEVPLGVNAFYPSITSGAKLSALFSNHLSILGSSGSGKSCAFASLIQNLFRKDPFPKNASFVVVDSFGEYEPCFRELSEKNREISFKYLTTNKKQSPNILKIPLWLLDIDDLALLLNIKSVVQLPILEKALKYVDVFSRKEEDVVEYKTSIIAKALIEILTSGRNSSQIRDQFISVLSRFHTSTLNLETSVYQPGYVRPIKQCLLIDESGKIRSIETVINFLKEFVKEDIVLNIPDKSYPYNLDDLAYAMEFAMIDEGILRNESLYNDIYYIKNNLDTLRNSSNRVYFDYPKYITELDFIKNILYEGDKKCQIININISFIDDRYAKNIIKIYSKIFYDFSRNLEKRASVPINIVLEEAHRYVQNDNDVNIIGYNIFDRIAKEGRKYGIMLTLITQRSSELSETVISQCSNFMLFKMIHPDDINFIKNVIPDISDHYVEGIKNLAPGNCFLVGSAFKIPSQIKVTMPNPAPMSSNCNIENIWF